MYRNPFPSSPIRLRRGTRTSSKNSSAVSLLWRSIFRSRLLTVKPFESVGTTKRLTPSAPAPPVRAASITKWARVPLVMKVLAPRMT